MKHAIGCRFNPWKRTTAPGTVKLATDLVLGCFLAVRLTAGEQQLAPGWACRLLSSKSLSLPLADCTLVATNDFAPGGGRHYANSYAISTPGFVMLVST
jgi:hypothetical protein